MAAKKSNSKNTDSAKIKQGEAKTYADLLGDRGKKAVERVAPFEPVTLPEGSRRKANRVGRGRPAGQGKTCGRGQKGQKSRSGYSRQFGFEGGQMPLHRRLPKRGFTNIFKVQYQLLNLQLIEKAGLSGEVTPELLAERGLIGNARKPVKILGNGDFSKNISITADAFSGSARKKIEGAGGSCTVRTPKELRRLVRKQGAAAEKKPAAE